MTARTALVSTYYAPVIGGAEAAAERLAGYLARHGHEVFVITKRTSRDHSEHENIEGVPVWRRPPIGPRSALGKWLFLPWVVGGLLARRHQYDVIVVVDQRATGVAALAAARWLGKPLVIQPQTQGTLDGRHPQKTGWRDLVHRTATWPLRQCYSRADAAVCITHSIVAEGRALGMDASRLAYVPNPVDESFFLPVPADERQRARADLGIAADDVVFVYTGRLSREKGIRELLAAWKVAARPGLRLLVIGPDMVGHPWNEGPEARALVAREHLEATVTFLGPRSHADVGSLMRLADVGVLPSHFEAHPVAGVEAMACGLPLIASRVGGVPDFVRDEENGLLVPPQDVAALTRAIERAARDAAWRVRAGRAARDTVRAFSADVLLARFAGVIGAAATRTAGAAPVAPA
ncbi:MAG TPA: glycosyltransferase family 4 protein [Vicinamibacterales bacterium]|nr:glycosyltransferase family 4 protein [Vicinamibacterales bacterium]